MADIKKKGQARLQNFNKKLDSVKEAEHNQAKKGIKTNQEKNAEHRAEIDQALDREITQGMNTIHGAITVLKKPANKRWRTISTLRKIKQKYINTHKLHLQLVNKWSK